MRKTTTEVMIKVNVLVKTHEKVIKVAKQKGRLIMSLESELIEIGLKHLDELK